jgi:hypothetical protein
MIENNQNQLSSEIIEVNSNLVASLVITPNSERNVIALLSYKNLSDKDTFFMYKPLLPDGDNILEELFGGFAVSDYTPIIYTGKNPRSDTLIKPILQPNNFIFLLPKTQVSYKINLAKNFDFESLYKKNKKSFAISIGVFMPAINSKYEQIYKIDTLDKVSKPLYYHITFPENKDVDSMRVYFTIP